jgi:hypothetical protein
MRLIREYGLDMKGIDIRKDVDLYVACAVYLDKINKVGRIVEFEVIPED